MQRLRRSRTLTTVINGELVYRLGSCSFGGSSVIESQGIQWCELYVASRFSCIRCGWEKQREDGHVEGLLDEISAVLAKIVMILSL